MEAGGCSVQPVAQARPPECKVLPLVALRRMLSLGPKLSCRVSSRLSMHTMLANTNACGQCMDRCNHRMMQGAR